MQVRVGPIRSRTKCKETLREALEKKRLHVQSIDLESANPDKGTCAAIVTLASEADVEAAVSRSKKIQLFGLYLSISATAPKDCVEITDSPSPPEQVHAASSLGARPKAEGAQCADEALAKLQNEAEMISAVKIADDARRAAEGRCEEAERAKKEAQSEILKLKAKAESDRFADQEELQLLRAKCAEAESKAETLAKSMTELEIAFAEVIAVHFQGYHATLQGLADTTKNGAAVLVLGKGPHVKADRVEVTTGSPTHGPYGQVRASCLKGIREAYPADFPASVQSLVGESRFPEALEACVSALFGHAAVKELLRELGRSWSSSSERQAREHQNEMNGVTARIQAAQEQTTELRQRLRQTETQLHSERTAKDRALEGKATAETQAQNLRRELNARQAPLFRHLARLECRPLADCPSAERPAMRKKLQLKWHPDKQPSPAHAQTATSIFQEIQNQREWTLP